MHLDGEDLVFLDVVFCMQDFSLEVRATPVTGILAPKFSTTLSLTFACPRHDAHVQVAAVRQHRRHEAGDCRRRDDQANQRDRPAFGAGFHSRGDATVGEVHLRGEDFVYLVQDLCVQDFILEQGIAGDTHLGGKDFASLVVDFGTQDFSLEMKATAGAKDNIE